LDRVYCFKTKMPFDTFDGWAEFRSLPLDQQMIQLKDPAVRARLVQAVHVAYAVPHPALIAGEPNPKFPEFEILRVMRHNLPDVSVADLARERGLDPVECILELEIETNFEQTYARFSTASQNAEILAAMRHPRTIMTFSDSGAHVTYRSGADLQTTLLAEWVRDRQAFTLEEAVRMITLTPALTWQIPNRGLLAENMIADINVFDPDTISPAPPLLVNDLPAGAMRVTQRSVGISSTIVGGSVVFREGEHTGALPGQLIRR
jgi:N-acyl-D-amino-acid deacylase